MKYALVALVVLLAGCAWCVDDTYDPAFDIPATGATTPQEVCRWVDTRVRYVSDDIHDMLEYWQSPDQTWAWAAGDCEDYALLVMYLLRRDLGGWPALVLGHYDDGTTRGGHAWVAYNGRWYEAMTGEDVTGSPWYTLHESVSYGVAMWRSMNTHKSMLEEE
ncbi:MAG: transglutaminase-like cysteine peptidase [Candidatus Omnitrophica bacterium]|nr:transglutaminase-like cysteine peptidase [Candidatus Omnitrophota bacterium]